MGGRTVIEVQIKDVVSSIESFKQLTEKSLNAVTAYKITKLMRALESEYQIFEQTRNEIIQKYSEKTDDGQIKINNAGEVVFIAAERDKALQEISNLLETSTSLNASKISLKDLEEIKLTPSQMNNLYSFIEE